jgi:dihydropteroate synthase
VLDPGVGFAKRSEHSLAVLAGLPRLVALGRPVMVGVSRKRFIGELTNVRDPADRVDGTTGANVAALAGGARLFRVHDVRAARRALDVAWEILSRAASAAPLRDGSPKAVAPVTVDAAAGGAGAPWAGPAAGTAG